MKARKTGLRTDVMIKLARASDLQCPQPQVFLFSGESAIPSGSCAYLDDLLSCLERVTGLWMPGLGGYVFW